MANKIVEILDLIIAFIEGQDLLAAFLSALSALKVSVNWIQILKVTGILLLALALTSVLFLANDIVFDRYMQRRIKTHKLTITNRGNTSSIFLLRTIDLPQTLAIRFCADERPLIKVTYQKTESEQDAVQPETEKKSPGKSSASGNNQADGSVLIPDLNDPLNTEKKTAKDTVGEVTKGINDVGKKAGFLASILSNISSLLPKNIAPVQDAQSALKGVQQDATQLTSSISTKANTAQNLGDQLGQLPLGDKVTSTASSLVQEAEGLTAGQITGQVTVNSDPDFAKPEMAERYELGQLNQDMMNEKYLVYDEEVWMSNIDKVDDKGGSLNYFQTNILDPNESMKIDVEIMNLADNSSSVSHLYKIEVVQIPQTRLHLTAPNRFVNGIVTYDKVSQLERLLPHVIVIGLIILSVQIVAAVSYLIF